MVLEAASLENEVAPTACMHECALHFGEVKVNASLDSTACQ
jgi:hypothetical protein